MALEAWFFIRLLMSVFLPHHNPSGLCVRVFPQQIVKTKFDRLGLSRTVATEYALDASGEVVDTGSNYDKATGKARKK
jgi:hypothetical protein